MGRAVMPVRNRTAVRWPCPARRSKRMPGSWSSWRPAGSRSPRPRDIAPGSSHCAAWSTSSATPRTQSWFGRARSFERHAESLSCRPKGALMSRPSRSLQSRRRRALASVLAARTRRCSSLIFVVRSTVLRSGGRLPGHPAHGMAQAFAHPRTHPPGARGARAYPAGSR